MTARAFLVRGLLAGLLAGLATFLVASVVGEPHVEAAVALESGGAGEEGHSHGEDAAGHSHDDGEAHSHGDGEADAAATSFSRGTQRTWGLATATLAVGVALGGLLALVAAGTLGRLGRLTPGQSTALVALVGFASVALVPFLKYPSTPPAVGSGDTIGDRTGLYFGFLVVSVAAAVIATYAATRLHARLGTYGAVVAAAAGYLVAVVVASSVFAPAERVGDFPADLLWSFRLSSLLTLATLWGVLGVALTGLVSHLHGREAAATERRRFAASL